MSEVDKLIKNIYNKLECSKYIIDHSTTVYERTKDITPHYDNIDLTVAISWSISFIR